MSLEPTEGVLSALGLKLINVVVGAVSAFVALRFFEGLSVLDRWITFLGGWAIAAWGAGPLAIAIDSPRIETGLVLILGLCGMSLAARLIELLRSVNWELVKSLLQRK